jgi:hypothetical protein
VSFAFRAPLLQQESMTLVLMLRKSIAKLVADRMYHLLEHVGTKPM